MDLKVATTDVVGTNWCVYMLLCRNDSIYTGCSNRLQGRVIDHYEGRGAKYTRAHKPVKLLAVFVVTNRSEAQSLEWRIKRLRPAEKMILALHGLDARIRTKLGKCVDPIIGWVDNHGEYTVVDHSLSADRQH